MHDNSFPNVLLCSTLGSFLSLAAVWISAAYTYAPSEPSGARHQISHLVLKRTFR